MPKRPEIIQHMISHIGTVGDAIERAEEYGLAVPGTNGTQLTSLGKKRDAMGHDARVRDRASQRSGHKSSAYKVLRGGRAILK